MYTYLEIVGQDETGASLTAPVIRQKREVRGQAYDLIDVFDFKGDKGEEQLCLICLSTPPDCIIMPCRHMVVNVECAKLIDEKKDTFECPLCRTEAEELIYVNAPLQGQAPAEAEADDKDPIVAQKSVTMTEIHVVPDPLHQNN